MSQKIAMHYPTIQQVSQGFKQAAQILRTVAKVLDALIQILRAMAFASMGTSLALANYLQTIKEKIEKLAKVCEWFSQNLDNALKAHQQGVSDSAQFFTQGIAL